MPEILPENVDSVKVYQMVKHQFVTVGMGEPCDINFLALIGAMNELGLEGDERELCRTNVLRVCHELLAEDREKREIDRKTKEH